jgi:hypothetical protein
LPPFKVEPGGTVNVLDPVIDRNEDGLGTAARCAKQKKAGGRAGGEECVCQQWNLSAVQMPCRALAPV